MTIEVSNLGKIRYAEFDMKRLTVVCGKNNTGKTYVTHALYGLFDYLRNEYVYPVEKSKVSELIEKGSVRFVLDDSPASMDAVLNKACAGYAQVLYKVLAGSEKHFKQSLVRIRADKVKSRNHIFSYRGIRPVGGGRAVEAYYEAKGHALTFNLLSENGSGENGVSATDVNYEAVKRFMCETLRRIRFGGMLPRAHISSVERTGAAIFQKELDFTASGMLELLRNTKDCGRDPAVFMRSYSGRYPLAVRRNVDFIRDLPTISNRESWLLKRHPDLLEDFADIIGGSYRASRDGIVYFVPSGKGQTSKLALVESSSSVRSLLDVGFYLRHLAAPGDLFMIDEPELNLHPENQRRLARLFARLVNHGIRVFMTTHSDYIVKEFNTLMMLNRPDERLKALARREGYKSDELLTATDVGVHVAQEGIVLKPGSKRRAKAMTLVPASISQEEGAVVPSFDGTIDEMNRIQDAIVWGNS